MIEITSVEEMDNPGDETGKLKIYYGVIDNIAYISFDAIWVRLQFKIPGKSNILARVVYGHTSPLEWKEI